LIAIVAGNLKKLPTSTGKRTFVISEPDKIDSYVEELKEME
jgi:leukotriene-A4 hydrolase